MELRNRNGICTVSRVCMMRDWDPLCEVCKLELRRVLNNRDYVSRQASVYDG